MVVVWRVGGFAVVVGILDHICGRVGWVVCSVDDNWYDGMGLGL